jgi:hypothetical protein
MQLKDDDAIVKKYDAGAKVAFLGNSIQYYNDCPRFLVNLGKGSISHQDSCLRGGANLLELWYGSAGGAPHWASMRIGFSRDAKSVDNINDLGSPTVQALFGCDDADVFADGISEDKEGRCRLQWDFVVLNDHTQGPARSNSWKATRDVLLDKYLPLISDSGATPIVIETAAYRYPAIHNSEDLGSTREFQKLVREGVQSYVEVMRTELPPSSRPSMAPVGTAFLYVHDNNHELWEGLFDPYDNFHPSPSGTFLQGCVLHWTMFGSPPPLPRTEEGITDLWRDARVMHDVRNGEIGAPLPSLKGAEYLWNVSKEICTPTIS